LGFVGIADDEGDTGKGGEFFGGALGVAAGDDDFCGRVGGMEFTDGVAGLGVGGGGDGAGVEDDDVGLRFGGGRSTATVEEVARWRRRGLGGAAAVLNAEGGHAKNI
jgi:hypothetical protein